MRWVFVLCAGLVLSGCSTHTTRQIDRRPDGTEITTRARSLAFMAGKSAVRDVKISQTEKTQGMSLGRLDQESDATGLTQAIGAIVVQGMAAYLTGGASTLRAGSQSPTALPMSLGEWTVPKGMKAVQRGNAVVLVPVDDPSKPVPELIPPSPRHDP